LPWIPAFAGKAKKGTGKRIKERGNTMREREDDREKKAN
jgi:hypothetical protein